MTDHDPVTGRLELLREPGSVDIADPHAVRARGNRIRRRRSALAAVAAGLAVAAVVLPLRALGTGDEGTAPTPADRPSDSASSAERAADLVRELPPDLPLLEGWPRPDAEVRLAGPSARVPPVVARACGQASSAPREVRDRLTAHLLPPAESRSREVRLYPTVGAAKAAASDLRAVFEACPREVADVGIPFDYVTTVADEDLGPDAWAARRSYDNPAQAGRAVFVSVRVRNVLLLADVTDEGTDADALAREVLDALAAPYESLRRPAP